MTLEKGDIFLVGNEKRHCRDFQDVTHSGYFSVKIRILVTLAKKMVCILQTPVGNIQNIKEEVWNSVLNGFYRFFFTETLCTTQSSIFGSLKACWKAETGAKNYRISWQRQVRILLLFHFLVKGIFNVLRFVHTGCQGWVFCSLFRGYSLSLCNLCVNGPSWIEWQFWSSSSIAFFIRLSESVCCLSLANVL